LLGATSSGLFLIRVFFVAYRSGLTAVYTEKVLKESNSGSIWITNIQMCSVSMLFSIFLCWNDRDVILSKGVFYGFSYTVWLMIINQAIGGVLIAAVFFFSDSVAKAYAGAIALILIRHVS
jgi:UDP-galactose transporter